MPVRKGTPMGAFGTQDFYGFDSCEVAYVTPGGS